MALIDHPIIHYRYVMGFKIDNVAIPDPSSFTGKQSDLDTLGKRNALGNLKRNLVATKHPIKLEYSAIEWEMIQKILGLMTEVDSNGDPISKSEFSFTYPDPSTGTLKTRKCYVGDRDWGCDRYYETIVVDDVKHSNTYIGNLKFSVIEI